MEIALDHAFGRKAQFNGPQRGRQEDRLLQNMFADQNLETVPSVYASNPRTWSYPALLAWAAWLRFLPSWAAVFGPMAAARARTRNICRR